MQSLLVRCCRSKSLSQSASRRLNHNISVFLTHPSVECWNLNPSRPSVKEMRRQLPSHCQVTICLNENEFVHSLKTAHIAIIWGLRPDWLCVSKSPSLRWIVTPAAGNDYLIQSLSNAPRITDPLLPPDHQVSEKLFIDRGIDVSFGSFHGKIIAESVLSLMLGMCRGTFACTKWQSRGRDEDDLWPRHRLSSIVRRFHGSRVVIIGYGNIGQEIGKLCRQVGAMVTGIVCNDRLYEKDVYGIDVWSTKGDRDRLCRYLVDLSPDHLVVALPNSLSANSILDLKSFSALPSSCFVYNVGRGNSIDEAALVYCLEHGKIAGACLDVVRQEPLPSSSILRKFDNVVITPHSAAIDPTYLDLFIENFIKMYNEKYIL